MANRFRFRLEAVRKVRKSKEDQCRRLVARRLRETSRIEAGITALTEQLGWLHGDMRSFAEGPSRAGSLDMTLLRRQRVYANYLQGKVAEARGQLADQRAELDREQGELAEARKQVKVIDKLEERRRAQYDLQMHRAERAEADETAGQFVLRRSRLRVEVMAKSGPP